MPKKDTIILRCSECKEENYTTVKNKKMTERLELKKYCPKCGRSTLHQEKK